MDLNPDELKVSINDSFLAPWVLANEEIPFHILWEGETDELEITIADEMEVVELHNTTLSIDEVVDDSTLRISSSQLSSDGYFSGIFKIKKIHEKSAVPYSIEARFHKNGVIQNLWRDTVRIIRPQIKVIGHPDKIKLNSGELEEPIEIDMQYVGYGMAKVKVTSKAGGELVSKHESVTHDLLRGFLETEFHEQNLDQVTEASRNLREDTSLDLSDDERENGIITEEEKDKFVQDMRRIATEGEIPEEWDSDDLYEMANMLEIAEEQSTDESDLTGAIYEFIEMFLLSSILNVVERHPADNVSLLSPETTIKTEAKAREINISIWLSDKMDNDYDPERISVRIEDKRDNGGIFEAAVVTNWINFEVKPKDLFN